MKLQPVCQKEIFRCAGLARWLHDLLQHPAFTFFWGLFLHVVPTSFLPPFMSTSLLLTINERGRKAQKSLLLTNKQHVICEVTWGALHEMGVVGYVACAPTATFCHLVLFKLIFLRASFSCVPCRRDTHNTCPIFATCYIQASTSSDVKLEFAAAWFIVLCCYCHFGKKKKIQSCFSESSATHSLWEIMSGIRL